MNKYTFSTIDGEPIESDKQTMVKGMLDYHASHGHPRVVTTKSILIKNANNILIGCCIVSFLWNGMEIGSLWVDEQMRGHGLGQKLMEMAEDLGREHGSTFAYTNTFTWQAPKFYEKLGYSIYGRLDDFPDGNSLTYYRKDLV